MLLISQTLTEISILFALYPKGICMLLAIDKLIMLLACIYLEQCVNVAELIIGSFSQ